MPHIYLPDKRRGYIGRCSISIMARNAALHFVKYCGYGVTAQGSFAIYIFVSGRGVDVHDPYTGRLLSAIMLFSISR